MKLRTIEKGFAGVALFLSTQALLPLLFGDSAADTGEVVPNRIIQGIWSVVYVITVLLLLKRWKASVRLIVSDKLLMSLIILAVASILWSSATAITLRRLIALIGTSAVGVYLAQRFTLREMLGILACALGVAAILSIVFAIAVPQLGIMSGTHEGAWRGIFVHKNHLGRYMALGAVVLSLLSDRREIGIVYKIGIVLCSILILLSTSKSALLVLGGAVLGIWYLRGVRMDVRVLVPYVIVGFLIAGSIAAWVALEYTDILQALGRDPTLTGRTVLWSLLIDAIGRRPWLGYGYDAFWTGWTGESGAVWQVLQWMAPHAHNGYLELCLNLGIVGLSLFLASFSKITLNAISWARASRETIGLWPMALLMFIAVYSISESVIMQRNNIFWILYVDIAMRVAMTGRLRLRQREQAEGGSLSDHAVMPMV